MNSFVKRISLAGLATLAFVIPANAGTAIEHGKLIYGGTKTAPMMILAASMKTSEDASPASHVEFKDLEISGAFARATLPGAPVGGGFVTITNNSDKDDRLVSVRSDAAGVMQLHNMRMDGDVMKMYQMPDGIPVPAHSTVMLEPGGMHIMFMKLSGPLEEGSVVNVELTFEDAGTVDVPFHVKSFAARGQTDDDQDMHGAEHDDGGMDMPSQ